MALAPVLILIILPVLIALFSRRRARVEESGLYEARPDDAEADFIGG